MTDHYTITTEIIDTNKVEFTIKEKHSERARVFVVRADKDGLHISSNDRIGVLPLSAVNVEIDNIQ